MNFIKQSFIIIFASFVQSGKYNKNEISIFSEEVCIEQKEFEDLVLMQTGKTFLEIEKSKKQYNDDFYIFD